MSKSAIVIGSGLGGLSTALRLSSKGFKVKVLEKYKQAGGRLNKLEKDGFTFDMGPSFFSMSYEFRELFEYCKVPDPLTFNELNPLYAVYFSHKSAPYIIYKDLEELASQFPEEKDFVPKTQAYLKQAARLFHDTEDKIIRSNYRSLLHYGFKLARVPLRHTPLLFRTMWQELERRFDTEEVRIIFSLVAFFLGATPFDTPAVYSLLNYTEMQHDGYWNVQGGMYKITEEILKLCKKNGVEFIYDSEVTEVYGENGKTSHVKDQTGRVWQGDIFICNADAAAFRGNVLKREKYTTEKLDALDWTLAPFTIYLGVKGKTERLMHHNYFLGNNFREYSDKIFKTSVTPEKPYYYVNVSSKSNPECAPEGCENLFILCPVPDLRHKSDWSDSEALADTIIRDLSERIGFDLAAHSLTRTVMTPVDWQNNFNLYRGSGLGLAHGLNQVGGLRPRNKDEKFNNLYYVGASTLPGTGLPMVVISSKLVTERILNDHELV